MKLQTGGKSERRTRAKSKILPHGQGRRQHDVLPLGWTTALARFEIVVTVLVGLFAVAFHFRLTNAVGALWRDEVNTVNLATLPSFGELFRFLEFDSFPILFATLLRGWTAIFGADNDDALRALGLIIGLGVLAVLFLNARALGSRLPILSLALVGLNPMVIRYGDSIRAYGLGILLILLTLWSFWRLVETESAPSAKRIGIAAICALLSVHCLYYNSVLLLAIAIGAMAVAARRRHWRTVLIILAIGLAAAVSLLPYAPIILRTREWAFMVHYPGAFAWLWKRASEVTGSPLGATVWLWPGLAVGGILLTVGYALVRRKSKTLPELPAPILFAAVTTVAGIAGYAGFLRVLSYYTQPWYYITLAAFVACTLDIVFGAWPKSFLAVRLLRVVIALALLSFATPSVWSEIRIRHTNADLVAARLEGISKPGDLILVPRWECALPLVRYYHGPAEIVTLPPIADHRFHRYDLILAQIKTQDAHLPVLAKMEEALRGGHRVYFAGKMPLPESSAQLPVLHPFYRDENGVGHGSGYTIVWPLYAGQLLATHAAKIGSISLEVAGYDQVQKHEDLGLGAAEGWRD